MKSSFKVIFAALAVSLSSLGNTAWAADPLGQQARDLSLVLDVLGPDLTTSARSEIADLLVEAERIARDHNDSSNDLICFASTSRPGKFFIAARSAPNTRIGNYYASQADCQTSKLAVKNGITCQQSDAQVGKGYLLRVDRGSDQPRIGNYYSSFPGCIEALRKSRNNLVCMESTANVGKWFLGDLTTADGARVGGYFNSKSDCFAAQ